MKNYDETITSVFERINKFKKEKNKKRRLVRKICLFSGCFCVILAIGVLSTSALLSHNSNKNGNVHSECEKNNIDMQIIYGVDDYSKIETFEVKSNNDYLSNISESLRSEMKENENEALYGIIIVGTALSGRDFFEFKYEGYNYYEYAEFLEKAEKTLAQEIEKGSSKDEYKIYMEEIDDCNNKINALIEAYNEQYDKTYDSVYAYLKMKYSFVNYQEPVDFEKLCLEEYQMLAVASYKTIELLAKDNFMIYLAPEDKKERVQLNDAVSTNISERVMRDLARGDTIEAAVLIKIDEKIEDSKPEKFDDYLYQVKLDLMSKYGVKDYIVEKNSVLPYILCSLAPDQIKSLANDESVDIIFNACELGRYEEFRIF